VTYIPEALRRKVLSRSENRCEYCRWHQDHAFFTHEIDHIYAEKHGGKTIENNLCLACAICNRHKSSDLCSLDPVTGSIVTLFHPRTDQWNNHFAMLPNGFIDLHSLIWRVIRK
jgi:hypothetical protein